MLKKEINIKELPYIRKEFKNKKIGLAHGVFDLFHHGHLLHLKKAKEQCDILIVSITSDKFVNKAPDRPYYSAQKRIQILAAIDFIDYVTIADFRSSVEVISGLKPDIYFKGSEYRDVKKDFTGKIDKELKVLKKFGGKVAFTNEKVLSSSNIINNFFSNLSEELKDFLRKNKKNFTFLKIFKIYEKIKKQKILVIGDAIIDEYVFCSGLAKSPKEQIISMEERKIEKYNGGILATANHVSNFVNNVTLVTLMGFSKLYNKDYINRLNKNINKKIFFSKSFPTIIKTRYLDNDDSKIFQKTNLSYCNLDHKLEKKILLYLTKNLVKFDQVIVNDFGHGLLTEKIIKLIQKKSSYLCVNVQTNSSNNGFNFVTRYKKAFYISIDEPEARLATQIRYSPIGDLFKALRNKINYKLCSITFGKNGTNISNKKNFIFIPVISKNPVDTLGAGDAYFAISSIFSKYLIKHHSLIGLLGNIAASLKIQYLGHRTYINKDKFFAYLKTLFNI